MTVTGTYQFDSATTEVHKFFLRAETSASHNPNYTATVEALQGGVTLARVEANKVVSSSVSTSLSPPPIAPFGPLMQVLNPVASIPL